MPIRSYKCLVELPDFSNNCSKSCPRCICGVLIRKNGPFGDFYGCSNYPLCKHIKNI